MPAQARADALRTVKLTVSLTPGLFARLERMARRNRWTSSTAAMVLIERGLDAGDGAAGGRDGTPGA